MSKQIDYSKGIYDARQLGAGRMFILGVQHMFAMFGATVLVPLLTGLSVSTTLLSACRDYFAKTGRRISFEYTMIDGVSDSPEQAQLLAKKLAGMGGTSI